MAQDNETSPPADDSTGAVSGDGPPQDESPSSETASSETASSETGGTEAAAASGASRVAAKDALSKARAAGGRDQKSARAVKRAARSANLSGGGTGTRLRQRSLGFPMLLVAIFVLGSALVAYAYSVNASQNETRPQQLIDHWHSAYAVWDCADGENGYDENGEPIFKPVFESSRDERGVHSHQDGVIHIHPFVSTSSGKNANFDAFMSEMGLTDEGARITDDAIHMPDGTRLEEGVDCGGEPAIIQIARWYRLSQTDKKPVIYTEDLGKVRFLANGEAFTIARAPEGAEIPPPPPERRDHARGLGPYSEISPNGATNPFDNPELYEFDEDGNPLTLEDGTPVLKGDEVEDATTTTVEGETTTTVEGETTTTVEGETTTTVEGETTTTVEGETTTTAESETDPDDTEADTTTTTVAEPVESEEDEAEATTTTAAPDEN